MKLKKIASLALAGVMAVSMLAGCATNKPEEKPGEGEGEGTVTTTGFSATLEDAVDVDQDYVTYADNKDDQAALEKAVASLSTTTVEDIAQKWEVPTDLKGAWHQEVAGVLSTLKSDLNVPAAELSEGQMNAMNWYANSANNETNTIGIRTGVVYAFNGGMDTDYALNVIAKKVADSVKALPDESVGGTTSWDYTYTVSASAVTRAQQDNYTAATNSTTFVLVTISRTVTNAKV